MDSNSESGNSSAEKSRNGEGSLEEDSDGDEIEVKKTSVSIPIPQFGSVADRGIIGIKDGISYGLGLMVYILALAVIAGVLGIVAGALGGAAAGLDNLGFTVIVGLIAFVFTLATFVVFAAGFAGIQYKIIADAVNAGSEKNR